MIHHYIVYWFTCSVFMSTFPCLVANTLSYTENELTLTMNGWSDPSSVSDKSLSSSSSPSGPPSVHSGCCGIRLMQILWIHISIYNTLSSQYMLTQCTAHTSHRSYYAAITLTMSVRRLYLHWTKPVFLAKYWLWLPDVGFLVNRNMLEQLS